MKSKQDILAFLKWVIVPLLFGGLQACRLAPPSPQSVSPAISHTNASEPTATREVTPSAITPSIGTISTNTLSHIEAPEPAAITEVTPPGITPSTGTISATALPAASVAADTGVDPQEINDTQEFKNRLTQLEEKERENHTLVLEGQRKTICWWFVFLAVLTAVLVVFGALVPFLRSRKDKELIQQMLTEAREAIHIIKEHHAAAGRTVEEIKHQLDEARKIAENFRSDEAVGGVNVQKTKEAVATIQKDPKADFKLKLRAEAIAASQDGKAEKAYALWRALAELDPDDSSAQFNTGHWAHCLGEKSRGGDALGRLRQAGRHYQQALTIKPDKHEAALNWGVVLANEAQALAASDLAAARALWQRAGEKYQQALTIKPDKYDAALNWGVALADEAQALAASDLPAARALWQQAGEKYQQALTIKPDDESAHFGSAGVWALLGQVQECCSSLARWRKCKLDAKRSDLDASLDFDSVRNIPEFRAFRESLPE